MAQLKPDHTFEFDSMIIGGGLTGLLVAHQAEAAGQKVVIIDAQTELGGNSRTLTTAFGESERGLKFIPYSEESEGVLRWLEQILGYDIGLEVREIPPVTFDHGKLQPFVGFGDFSPVASREFDNYGQQKWWSFSRGPKDWVATLVQSFTGTVWNQSELTKFMIEDHFIVEAVVNGAKRVSAREVYFCAPPRLLGKTLPEGLLPARVRQKLTKGELLASVNLDLVHGSQITESEAVHILKGANEEPFAGRFLRASKDTNGKPVQHSQWQGFFKSDLTDDSESVANEIKNIKRQIKRAYPEALNDLRFERLSVNPESNGDLGIKLSAELQLSPIENLRVVSPQFYPEIPVFGALKAAFDANSKLSFSPIILDDGPDLDSPAVPNALGANH